MALAIELPERRLLDMNEALAALRSWGNWYIKRTAHDFGWPSHNSCLGYFGLFVGGHKILFDTPAHVRFVDVSVGQLNELLRQALALHYWWHQDLHTGEHITDRQRADALGLSTPSQFREVLRTARLVAQRSMQAIDLRREPVNVE